MAPVDPKNRASPKLKMPAVRGHHPVSDPSRCGRPCRRREPPDCSERARRGRPGQKGPPSWAEGRPHRRDSVVSTLRRRPDRSPAAAHHYQDQHRDHQLQCPAWPRPESRIRVHGRSIHSGSALSLPSPLVGASKLCHILGGPSFRGRAVTDGDSRPSGNRRDRSGCASADPASRFWSMATPVSRRRSRQSALQESSTDC